MYCQVVLQEQGMKSAYSNRIEYKCPYAKTHIAKNVRPRQ